MARMKLILSILLSVAMLGQPLIITAHAADENPVGTEESIAMGEVGCAVVTQISEILEEITVSAETEETQPEESVPGETIAEETVPEETEEASKEFDWTEV